jgi:tRNA threonylcarbamoyladenosine biosynthesis protein TsaE
VAALRNPCGEPDLGLGEIGVRNRNRLETELRSPSLDVLGELPQAGRARRGALLARRPRVAPRIPATLPGTILVFCLVNHSIDHNASFELILPDEASTARLGARLALALRPGMHIYLSGELGSGKTTLARGVLRGLGYTGRVKSPSYALLESYVVSSLYLYHFDFYRFHSPQEWSDAGFEEAFDGVGVCLVEWPEKAAGLLPPPDVLIAFLPAATGRRVLIGAHTETGERCVSALKSRGDTS